MYAKSNNDLYFCTTGNFKQFNEITLQVMFWLENWNSEEMNDHINAFVLKNQSPKLQKGNGLGRQKKIRWIQKKRVTYKIGLKKRSVKFD